MITHGANAVFPDDEPGHSGRYECKFCPFTTLQVEMMKMHMTGHLKPGPLQPKAEVKLFTGVTCLDLPADRILDNVPRDLASVVIMGYTADGGEYFASSYAGGGDVLC